MFEKDLGIFFNGDFADVANFGAIPIAGIFDNEYADGMDIAGSAPTFLCATDAAAQLSPGTSTLILRSSSWMVMSVEDDGTGVSIIRLQRQ